jgi:predicted transposase/invertase (TIGR01784 family)
MSEKQQALSPLADPVVGAIFDSVENAGLAAQSLVGSILAEDGIKIKRIISVTPQKINIPNAQMRATRVDILIETADKESIIVEVQMCPEPLLERNLLAVSQQIATNFEKGTTAWEVKQLFPIIYAINIMDYPERNDNDDYIQPVKLMYEKSPHKVAFDNIKIYNIELPKFRTKEHNLTNPLEAWLYILDTANLNEISVEEVISMNEILRNTVSIDPGLTQFVRSYDVVTADEKLREEYDLYARGLLYYNGIRRRAYDDGIEEGMLNTKRDDARRFLKIGLSPEQVAEGTELPIETVRELSENL